MVHVALVTTLLGRSDLFGSLSEADRMVVARKMREAHYAANELIFARGDPAIGVHLVVEGRVRLSVLSADGHVLSFNHAGVGSIFGEIATLDGGLRTADATALTASRTMVLDRSHLLSMVEANASVARAAIAFVCARLRNTSEQVEATALTASRTMVLDRSHLLSMVEANASVARAAIAFVCARLRTTSKQVEAIALHPIQVRLARFLLTAITLGNRPIGGTGLASLDIGTSQTELAQLLGASRQKLNAALANLQETGAITRNGARRMDCNVRELERIAGPK